MPANSLDDRKTCDERAARTMPELPRSVAAGAAILVRGRRWRLEATVPHDDCEELRLAAAEDGRKRLLLWPFDRPAAIETHPALHVVRLRRWAAGLHRGAAATIDPLTPRSVARSIDIVAFQLAPAVAMAAGTARLLLADEVGLGKTVQAGWIVADLIARDAETRVLLAVPAGLRHQWIAELSAGFSVDPIAVDARWLRRAVADLPADVSPWTAPGVYVASLDFVKRVDVLDGLEQHLWDLLVVDEAHGATAPTDRHAALARIAAKARRVVAITATPYSGNPASFSSLTSMGATAVSPPPLMFRRSRGDVGDGRRRRHRFAQVRLTAPESTLQRLLERYSQDVWKEAQDDPDGARLAVTILRKRALSSPVAVARSLRRRLDLLQGRAQVPRQLPLFADEDVVDDDVGASALAAPGLADAGREHRCLELLIAAADAAGGSDSKLRYLNRLIDRVRGDSVVVFTEYRDTLLQLAGSRPGALQLHGGLTAADRAAVQQRFNREGGLLLATDAAAEGLNLHHHCRFLISYELPWNPARLEQRIGRVDRIGQRRTVHALTLTARDTAEDLVIRNLTRRLTRIAAALGSEDRLAAFLNDARTARIVIGGDAIEIPEDPATDHATSTLRDDGDLSAAARAAAQIGRRRAIGGDPQSPDAIVLVSSMRAHRPLPPGYVVAVWCTARTVDGQLAGARQFLLHVRGSPSRPCTAAEARRVARSSIQALDPETLRSVAGEWFEGIARAHDGIASARLARERELMTPSADRDAVQPGLFDRRALADSERMDSADSRRQDSHRREIVALERGRTLHLTCAISAVLILWG